MLEGGPPRAACPRPFRILVAPPPSKDKGTKKEVCTGSSGRSEARCFFVGSWGQGLTKGQPR